MKREEFKSIESPSSQPSPSRGEGAFHFISLEGRGLRWGWFNNTSHSHIEFLTQPHWSWRQAHAVPPHKHTPPARPAQCNGKNPIPANAPHAPAIHSFRKFFDAFEVQSIFFSNVFWFLNFKLNLLPTLRHRVSRTWWKHPPPTKTRNGFCPFLCCPGIIPKKGLHHPFNQKFKKMSAKWENMRQ